jgi:hypothetical protein
MRLKRYPYAVWSSPPRAAPAAGAQTGGWSCRRPMAEAQRPLSTKPARLGQATLCVLLALGATSAAASGAVPAPSPEAPSPTPTLTAASPEAPQPEPPPQPARPARSEPQTAPIAPVESAPPEETVHVAAPVRAAATRASHPKPHRRPLHPVRRSHGARVRASALARASSGAVAATLSPLPGNRNDTLLLAAAAALGVVSLAGLTLQRLLVQLSRVSRGGPAT